MADFVRLQGLPVRPRLTLFQGDIEHPQCLTRVASIVTLERLDMQVDPLPETRRVAQDDLDLAVDHQPPIL